MRQHFMPGLKFYYEHCVRLCFYYLAFRVYDIFPPEEIAPEPDGGLLVRTRWPEGEWGVSFLLSFGGAVEVLDPPPLRAALRDAAADILKKYEKN